MKCTNCGFDAPIQQWNRAETTRQLTDKERQALLNTGVFKDIVKKIELDMDEETLRQKIQEMDAPQEIKDAVLNFTHTFGLPLTKLFAWIAELILTCSPINETIYFCPKCGAKV